MQQIKIRQSQRGSRNISVSGQGNTISSCDVELLTKVLEQYQTQMLRLITILERCVEEKMCNKMCNGKSA